MMTPVVRPDPHGCGFASTFPVTERAVIAIHGRRSIVRDAMLPITFSDVGPPVDERFGALIDHIPYAVPQYITFAPDFPYYSTDVLRFQKRNFPDESVSVLTRNPVLLEGLSCTM